MENAGKAGGRRQANYHLRRAGAVAAILIGAVILYWGYASRFPSVRQPGRRMVWYYNLSSGKLFAAEASEIPAATTPDGAPGVLARVFSCGNCNEVDNQWIGYLRRLPDDAAEKWRGLQPVPGKPIATAEESEVAQQARQALQQTQIAAPEAMEEWVNEQSDEAQAIRSAVTEKCPDGVVHECLPDSP